MTILEIMEELQNSNHSISIHKFGKADGYGHTSNQFTISMKYINDDGDKVEVSRTGSDFESVVREAYAALNRGKHNGVLIALSPPIIDQSPEPPPNRITIDEEDIPF